MRRLVKLLTCLVTAAASPGVAWAQPCSPMDRPELRARLESAEAAWMALDPDGFATSRDSIQRDLPCMSEVLLPRDAAWVHQIEAMWSYQLMNVGPGDKQAHRSEVIASWRAVLAAEPDFVLSPEIARPGVPLRDLFDEARLRGPGALVTLPELDGAGLSVNGSYGDTLPAEHPNLVQWLDGAAEVQATAYLPTGAGLPALWALPLAGEASAQSAGAGPTAQVTQERSGLQRWGMLGVAGATGLVAGGLYLGHVYRYGLEQDCVDRGEACGEAERAELEARKDRIYYASLGVGGVAVGLGVIGVVVAF